MYAGIQLGRTAYMLWLLRGERLLPVFVRIVPWTTATSVLVLIGSQQSDHVRAAVWAAAVAVDLAAAAVGFPVPHWGRSTTLDWTIAGGHFAERCQAFVLIALGESLVVIGTRLSDEHLSAATVAAFLAAVVGSIALWWVYFDRAADDSSDVIARSSDPGRLARNAFHWIHPVIVGGIIAAAAADDLLLRQPRGHPASSTVWLLLGGPALFLLGHAMFKAVVWRTVSAPRVVAATVLVALVPAGTPGWSRRSWSASRSPTASCIRRRASPAAYDHMRSTHACTAFHDHCRVYPAHLCPSRTGHEPLKLDSA